MTVQQHALIAGPVTVSRIAESHEQFSHLDRWSCETIWGHLVPLSKGLRGQDLQYHDSFCFMWVHLVVTRTIIHNLSKGGLHPDSYEPICKVEGGEQVYTCVTTKLLPCCHPHDAVFPNKPSMVWSKKLKSNRSEQNNSQMYRITEQNVMIVIYGSSARKKLVVFAGFPSSLRRFQSTECRRIATCIS